MSLDALATLLRDRRFVALTGAGCSTESGIPDYRGPDTPPRARPPIQHREFVDRADARQRYWARSVLGWPSLAAARPNPAHHALVALETRGLAGLITQNVDGLHGAARAARDTSHASTIVELHGALARVRCLACAAITPRMRMQDRLLAANPTFSARARAAALAPPLAGEDVSSSRPDGDVDLLDALITGFEVVACEACDGVLMPDVVFFGGSVPRSTLDAAWELFDRAEVLLVIGSSLHVFSGYRFVHRAAERGIPVAIVNRGPTRGDSHATLRVDARVGELLPALVAALAC